MDLGWPVASPGPDRNIKHELLRNQGQTPTHRTPDPVNKWLGTTTQTENGETDRPDRLDIYYLQLHLQATPPQLPASPHS